MNCLLSHHYEEQRGNRVGHCHRHYKVRIGLRWLLELLDLTTAKMMMAGMLCHQSLTVRAGFSFMNLEVCFSLSSS